MKFKIIFLILILGIIFILNKFSWQGEDVTILSINGEKVEMVNVSPERGVINNYEVKNMDIWIPNGMGWYPVSRLGLIIKDDVELAKKIAFYNFGFWPKFVVKQDNWSSDKQLISMLGPVGWLRFRLTSDDWLWRKELLKVEDLAEVMPRDLALNKILKADIKINIVNSSGKNGFGNMMADRLEWWGLMVTSVQTRDVEKETKIYVDFKSKDIETINFLAKIMGCKVINQSGSNELVLGTDVEEMVKYSQTYVRSF